MVCQALYQRYKEVVFHGNFIAKKCIKLDTTILTIKILSDLIALKSRYTIELYDLKILLEIVAVNDSKLGAYTARN